MERKKRYGRNDGNDRVYKYSIKHAWFFQLRNTSTEQRSYYWADIKSHVPDQALQQFRGLFPHLPGQDYCVPTKHNHYDHSSSEGWWKRLNGWEC